MLCCLEGSEGWHWQGGQNLLGRLQGSRKHHKRLHDKLQWIRVQDTKWTKGWGKGVKGPGTGVGEGPGTVTGKGVGRVVRDGVGRGGQDSSENSPGGGGVEEPTCTIWPYDAYALSRSELVPEVPDDITRSCLACSIFNHQHLFALHMHQPVCFQPTCIQRPSSHMSNRLHLSTSARAKHSCPMQTPRHNSEKSGAQARILILTK